MNYSPADCQSRRADRSIFSAEKIQDRRFKSSPPQPKDSVRNMNYLTLVFDDGPHRPICEIADKIAAFGWRAGFAVIGQNINKETLPMLKYVIDNGFQVVSHGQEHLHMETIPTREEIESEIYLPIKTLKEKLDYDITMTRLPYLSENTRALQVAKELNLPVLGWGISNGSDWDTSVTPEEITKAVLDTVCDGAIGCLHVRDNTCKALDVILPELKHRDFCLVTPEELFKQKGVTPPVGVPIHNVNDLLK